MVLEVILHNMMIYKELSIHLGLLNLSSLYARFEELISIWCIVCLLIEGFLVFFVFCIKQKEDVWSDILTQNVHAVGENSPENCPFLLPFCHLLHTLFQSTDCFVKFKTIFKGEKNKPA